MSDRRVTVRWNLRQLMAAQGMFQTSELMPLLADRGITLTRTFVYRLVTNTPQRINVEVLAALCDILNCTPNDLLELVTEPVENAKTGTTGHHETQGIGDLRPIRSTIRRPKTGE